MTPQKLILLCELPPGDVLTLTVAIESLHEQYPGEYVTDVRTNHDELWQGNPHITMIDDDDSDATRIQMHYPQIDRSNQEPVNFISCYTGYLGEVLGRPLRPMRPTPAIYLSEEEESWVSMVQEHYTGKPARYAVVNAGLKRDYTAKGWPVSYFQEVIDRTIGVIQWVQIGSKGDDHPDLKNVINVVGKTTNRQLLRLVFNASLGLGPVTYLLHICAAFDIPYIYLAGGREPVTWINYPKQHTLHTIGMLECCRTTACWRSRVVKLEDGSKGDGSLCEHPLVGLERPTAKCMAMITPDEVIPIVRKLCA
tara:strand:+ start:4137 stop:5063 length:927 start_codon:yes stop_codon:yes gene_type:complete